MREILRVGNFEKNPVNNNGEFKMLNKKLAAGLALLVLFIFGASSEAKAQERAFEDSALTILRDKAEELCRHRVLRLTILDENFEKGAKLPTNTEKNIIEEIPSDRSRFITEKRSPKGVERRETIYIGSQEYIRENAGAWELVKPKSGGSVVGMGNGNGEPVKFKTSSVNKFKPGVLLNKQKTDYYETVIKVTMIRPSATVVSYSKKAYWFDAQGRYVRILDEDIDGDNQIVERKTTDYEYDLNIKIEAPIK